MLQNRNLSNNDKKRLLLLATQEIEQGDASKNVSKDELGNNSDIESEGNTEDLGKKHRTGINSKIQYISPKNIQRFLHEFNQDDILKYTCHLIDTDEVVTAICKECATEEYDFTKHVELIRSRFYTLVQRLNKEGVSINSKIYAQVSTYLTGASGKNDEREKKDWSSNKIEINWNCAQIQEWATQNPHIIPSPGKNIARKQKNNGYILPSAFNSDRTGTRIKSFADLVIFFKSQFHIRQDNTLRSILQIVNKRWKEEDVNIAFIDGQFNDSVELFTDVDKLIQAYEKIIDICIENRSDNKEPIQIQLSFYDDANSKETFFCIHHTNTTYRKTSKNATERIGDKHSSLITNQINGLCDLYVEAKFGDGACGKLNLWDGESALHLQSLQDIIGVKYILRF